MIKVRVMPCLLLRELVLVKTVGFAEYYRPIGTPRQAVRVFNSREVDEMVILDIDATVLGRGPSLETIADLAHECFMPLTVGGGIRSISDIRNVLRVGADKVCINTEAVNSPQFVHDAAKVFGSQCIVVSIDVRGRQSSTYEVYTMGGRQSTGLDPVEWAKRVEDLGAGEILLTSIDMDGTMQGYDINLIESVAGAVERPVIACGGAGKLEDFADAVIKGRASAVAAASIYHFTEVTPKNVKEYMRQRGIETRV
jgi:cyclase